MSQAPPIENPAPGAGVERPIAEMRLRSNRPPVTRLSRKALLGLGAVAAVGIGGAVFFALRSQPKAARSELYNTSNRTTPEGLAGLPRDYAAVPFKAPQLGPPLPGDLGRPILNAGAAAPGMGAPSGAGSTPAPDPAQQRIVQEQDAARESRLFIGASVARTAAAAVQPPAPATPAVVPATLPAASGESGSSDHKLAFLTGAVDRKTSSSERVEPPRSENVVQAGAMIPAALLTGIRSDLPGQVTAQVTEDVYDSPTGKVLLIPQGAKLVGQYDAQITFGQSRALLVWNRLLLPNGRSITLERQPGADPQGYAGLEDKVDGHWGMLFKAAILSTVLSVGAEAGTSNSENNLAQAIRQGASQNFNQVGQQVVGRSLNVQPTITIRPGFPVRVMVTHDLVIEPYAG